VSAKIRIMVESDLDFALGLADREGWDYDLADLRRLRRIFPEGCFLAEYGGVKAGWVVVSTYGNLAWIGSLVVRDNLRGKGIGAALVDHAVRYARELGVKTVGLYSYRDSVGFYEKMGFKRDSVFNHVEGVGREALAPTAMQRPRDVGDVVVFDRRYFQGNRKLLLETLLQEFPSLLLEFQDETGVTGYIAAKNFADGTAEIGPWVCGATRTRVAAQLFASELSQLRSRRISLTIPSQNVEAHRITRKCGFRTKQSVTRMFLDNAEDLPRVDEIYAAAGLDVG